MDPIRPKGPNDPVNRPGEVSKSEGTGPADRKFEVDATSGSGGSGEVEGPRVEANFERIQSAIRQGLSESKTRDQILDGLVEDETARVLGADVPREVAGSVAESFRNDPTLKDLFDQLFHKATAEA